MLFRSCLVDGKIEGIKFKTKESTVIATQLNLSDRQATAILEMRLYKLIGQCRLRGEFHPIPSNILLLLVKAVRDNMTNFH